MAKEYSVKGDYYSTEEYLEIEKMFFQGYDVGYFKKVFNNDGKKIKVWLRFKSGYFYREGTYVYRTQIYDVLYKTPYEDLPMRMGQHPWLDELISWRINLGR